jgi:hypothetical protein
VTTELDTIGVTGMYPSITVDRWDKVHISYYYSDSGHLRYVTNSRGGWSTTVVDRNEGVGMPSAIATDDLGRVHISYYDSPNASLKYAVCSNDVWTYDFVDRGGMGKFSSLAMEPPVHRGEVGTDRADQPHGRGVRRHGPSQLGSPNTGLRLPGHRVPHLQGNVP